jgi:hypothetical protein
LLGGCHFWQPLCVLNPTLTNSEVLPKIFYQTNVKNFNFNSSQNALKPWFKEKILELILNNTANFPPFLKNLIIF